MKLNREDAEKYLNTDKPKYYLAVGHDRHIDDQYALFSRLDHAIQSCKDFMKGEDDIEEQKLDGYLYFASYGSEGDHVYVEEIILDEEMQ